MIKEINSPHTGVVGVHLNSRRPKASEDYLALHIEYNVAQLYQAFQVTIAIVAACNYMTDAQLKKKQNIVWINLLEYHTLNREPIDENFDDFEDSSGNGGNKPDTKEQVEALRSAWCSATT